MRWYTRKYNKRNNYRWFSARSRESWKWSDAPLRTIGPLMSSLCNRYGRWKCASFGLSCDGADWRRKKEVAGKKEKKKKTKYRLIGEAWRWLPRIPWNRVQSPVYYVSVVIWLGRERRRGKRRSSTVRKGRDTRGFISLTASPRQNRRNNDPAKNIDRKRKPPRD